MDAVHVGSPRDGDGGGARLAGPGGPVGPVGPSPAGPAVITGLGAVLPTGLGEAAIQALVQPAGPGAPSWSQPRAVVGYDPAGILGPRGLRGLDRTTLLLLGAAALALAQAGPGPGWDAWDGLGLVVASASAGLNSAAEFYREAVTLGARYVDPGRFPSVMVNAAASRAGMRFSARACQLTLAGAETGGPEAVDCARTLLRSGRARAMLVAAVEELSPLLSALRPASGEGAVALVLEPWEEAVARRARTLAQVMGFGAATAGADGPDPAPSNGEDRDCDGPGGAEGLARAGARAVRLALLQSGTAPGEVEAVFSGTAPDHPLAEVERRALEQGLGGRQPPRVEVKRVLGESLAAASLAQVAACAQALSQGGPRRGLVHCLGRNGQAAALVLGAVEGGG
ncbi:MAG: hypothetical protein K6T75_02810 [Acetobacteraceae bacterium]|nr:hypothetical protein [Acetobacteraceae bacterium]